LKGFFSYKTGVKGKNGAIISKKINRY